jgi:large subunit ribosomal protein L30
MGKMAQVRIKLVRSLIGVPEKHRKIIRALGLRKSNSEITKVDNPSIRGMIFKVQHLVDVERIEK